MERTARDQTHPSNRLFNLKCHLAWLEMDPEAIGNYDSIEQRNQLGEDLRVEISNLRQVLLDADLLCVYGILGSTQRSK